MKVTKLIIKNIGMIADTTIDLDKPLLLFYGQIRQGKSTILNAVRWVCGGEFPADIIRHGEKEAKVELHIDGGMISRSWYKAKDESTKARSVVFVRDGKPVNSPVSEIKRLLNPFLLDQDHLKNMNEVERKAFFIDLLGADTKDLDTELFESERKASELRSKISGYGEIDLVEVIPVDVTALQSELESKRTAWRTEKAGLESKLEAVRKGHEDSLQKLGEKNEAIRTHNSTCDRGGETLKSIALEITELEGKIAALREKQQKTTDWLKENPRRELIPAISSPDTTELRSKISAEPDFSALESSISNAAAQNVRAEQFAKNKVRSEAKKADEAELTKRETRQREIKSERRAKLKTISESCGIKELSFDEAGNFTYQNTQSGMLSTSQVMKLSTELSGLYPDGFGVELLDRAESLGRSIFDYTKLAEAHKSTILATIVGERPTNVPENIGVFVVSDGKVIPSEKGAE